MATHTDDEVSATNYAATASVPMVKRAAAPAVHAAPAQVFEYVAPPTAANTTRTPVIEYLAPAPVVFHAVPAPKIEHVAPTPAVTCAAPALVIEDAAPAPAVTCATPASVNAYVAPAAVTQYIAKPSAATLSFGTTGFVNPQFSVPAVEASVSHVVGSISPLKEFAAHVYSQVRQEQIAAEQKSVECVQQHTVEQIVHVPFPQIHEQIVKSVQVIPRDLVPERIEEQIVDIPFPPIVTEMEKMVSSSHTAAHAAPAPVNECVAPARDAVHGTPAPEFDVPVYNQVGQRTDPDCVCCATANCSRMVP